jgi:hypothetical protein
LRNCCTTLKKRRLPNISREKRSEAFNREGKQNQLSKYNNFPSEIACDGRVITNTIFCRRKNCHCTRTYSQKVAAEAAICGGTITRRSAVGDVDSAHHAATPPTPVTIPARCGLHCASSRGRGSGLQLLNTTTHLIATKASPHATGPTHVNKIILVTFSAARDSNLRATSQARQQRSSSTHTKTQLGRECFASISRIILAAWT